MYILFENLNDDCFQKLAYRLALLYIKGANDYSLLFMVASCRGLAPIRKSLSDKINLESEFFRTVRNAFVQSLTTGDVCLTIGQKIFRSKFFNSNDSVTVVIAPTSYGKSNLLVSYIEKSV